MTLENFKFPIMFDPHGLKFTIVRTLAKHADGDDFRIFVVTLKEGSTVIKTYLPTTLEWGARYQGLAVREIAPHDDSKQIPGFPEGFTYRGGRGVYLYVSDAAELVAPRGPTFAKKVGMPIATVSSTMPPLPRWSPSGQIVIFGRAQERSNRKEDASPIGPDALMMRDGKIVYIK